MSHAPCRAALPVGETLPSELLELRQRVQEQPPEIRAELEPLVEEAMEHARFRSRILSVARGALEQYKLDLEMTRFDLDATKRERESLLRLLDGRHDDVREN
jgi:hypothetical protein